jgi:PAS domain S-box-containing protein
MSRNNFSQEMELKRQHLAGLSEQIDLLHLSPQELLAELKTALELLWTSQQKVDEQEQALQAAHDMIQTERHRYQELLHERQQVEEALREEHHKLELEQKQLRLVLDIIPAAVWVVDVQGKHLAQSAMSKTIWAEEALPAEAAKEYKGWWPGSGQTIAAHEWSRVRALVQGETTINEEINIEAFDGRKKTILSSAVPIKDEAEAIVGAVVLNMDITQQKQVEQALRQSDARNRALLNAIPDLMFRISRQGDYLDYKPAKALNLFVPPSEFLGKTIFDVLPAELAQQMSRQIERALLTGEVQIYEYQLPINGKMRQREARLIASGPDEVLAIVRDITERKAREALLAEERTRIGRDLHDGLAQNLYFLGLKLDYIRKQITTAPENAVEELKTLKKTIQTTIDHTRRTIFALRPIELETLGFGPALRKYALEFGEQAGLEVGLQMAGDEQALPTDLEPVLFRLAQEGLTNIAKHAQASQARLTLAIYPSRSVALTIQDNGLGFEPAAQAANNHKIGLRQMQERVSQLGGQFTLQSLPGQGVTLYIEIPLSGGQ